MTNQAIVRSNAATTLPTIAEAMQLAGLFAQSNYFNDAKTAAQCIVKIEYGRELGIGPAAAMMGVHIIEGKPAPSANLMATLIKRSRRYDFRVRPDWDHEHCTIDFYERRELIGTINFTMAQARQIKDRNGGILADKLNWRNYPQAMLWARAMSAGARAFCADVFGGAPVYTAEELGADEPPMQPGDTATLDGIAVEIPDAGTPTAPEPAGRPQAVRSDSQSTSGAKPATAPAQDSAATQEPTGKNPPTEEDYRKRIREMIAPLGNSSEQADLLNVIIDGEPRNLTVTEVLQSLGIAELKQLGLQIKGLDLKTPDDLAAWLDRQAADVLEPVAS